MEDHAWRSASPGLSSSEGDTDSFDNEPTRTNNTTGSRHVHSHVTLEILQAHLDAGAESDSSEASGPRVHPDFFIHLENLRRVNEANRVNARREAETWYQIALMSSQSQYEAPRITIEANSESSQFANQYNQPSYHAGTEHGLQPSAIGIPEQYEIQDSTAAGPFQPMPHVRFETPDSAGHVFARDHSHHHRPPSPYPTVDPAGHAHTRDHSRHHRPPSPYPTAGRGQRSTFRNHAATTSTATPQPQGYTEHGNPYRIPFEPAPFPEGATPYDSERILQAWLVRQQLIAGVRPEDIQPMGQSSGGRHRTPPYIVLNDSGAHIIRIEPARFEGAMLPLPALPWLPRRPNNNSHTAPVSLNTLDASGPPTDPSITAAPVSANTLNSPVVPNMQAATNLPLGSIQQAPATILAAPALPVNYDVALDQTFVPEQTSEDLNEDVAESESSDSLSISDLVPGPSTPESGSNENSQSPVITPQLQSQANLSLAVQNHTDADSISSQEVSGVEVSPAHSQGRDSLIPSPSSAEGSEAGYVSSLQPPHGNGGLPNINRRSLADILSPPEFS